MNDTEAVTLRASAEQAGAGTVTGTVANGGAVAYDHVFTKAIVTLDVTALATNADDTLDVYIDISPDGGTTWINAVHFAQQAGDGSAAKFTALVGFDPSVEDLHTVTTDVAAGNTRQIGLGTQMRYRGVVVDPSGTNAAFTYSVQAFLFN